MIRNDTVATSSRDELIHGKGSKSRQLKVERGCKHRISWMYTFIFFKPIFLLYLFYSLELMRLWTLHYTAIRAPWFIFALKVIPEKIWLLIVSCWSDHPTMFSVIFIQTLKMVIFGIFDLTGTQDMVRGNRCHKHMSSSCLVFVVLCWIVELLARLSFRTQSSAIV